MRKNIYALSAICLTLNAVITFEESRVSGVGKRCVETVQKFDVELKLKGKYRSATNRSLITIIMFW